MGACAGLWSSISGWFGARETQRWKTSRWPTFLFDQQCGLSASLVCRRLDKKRGVLFYDVIEKSL
jgi:hypothetical protein